MNYGLNKRDFSFPRGHAKPSVAPKSLAVYRASDQIAK
jgi:hypothetical protein